MGRKRYSVMISLTFTLALALAACSGNNSGSKDTGGAGASETAGQQSVSPSPEQTAESTAQDPNDTRLSTTGETLSFAVIDMGADGPSYNDDNIPLIMELEKQTGVHIAFEAVYPDYSTVMRTRIAAANNLPDIIQLPQGDDPVKIAKDGIIVPLNDLIEQYAPHTKAFLDANPDIKKVLTAPDGNIYGFPGSVSLAGSEFNVNAIGYRADWAQKLNLPEPQTMEDWYNMLVAFRDGDPNGNGQADEIPLSASGLGAIDKFAQAYGMTPVSGWFAVDGQGKVEYSWTNPKARDYLTEMNRWWKEKLIDPGILTPHGDKVTAYVVGDMTGAYSIWAQRFNQYTKEMQANFPGAQWVVALPPEGPYGDRFYEINPPVDGNRFSVTKDAKNPELAVRWLDYLFASEEAQLLFNFGLEGVTYKLEDGKPVYTDEVTNNPKYSSPGAALSAYGSAGRFPQIITRDSLEQQAAIMMPEAAVAQLQRVKEYYRPKFPDAMSTPVESAAFARVMADINTYREEMAAKFITGTEPLFGFDTFVETLKSMGIDEAVAIKQAQYDRWNSIK